MQDIDLYSKLPRTGKYTPEDRMKAALAFVVTGSLKEVEKLTGIKRATLDVWRHKSDWWPLAVEEARRTKQEELDASFTRIIHKAIEELEDRVRNGDEVILRNGEKERQKVKARELAGVIAQIYEKRALMRGDPTKREEKSSDEKLQLIMKKFERFADEIRSRQEKVVSEQ